LIGDVAIDFMSRNRNVLFHDTPAVFYSLNPSQARPANSTGLINRLHFGPSIDLALALQPNLKQVYVVSGAAASDRSYESQASAEFRPFERRVAFTYFSGLVMQDLEERLRTLPPNSAVYYVVVRQDGAGEQFQAMAPLSRVAARPTRRPTAGRMPLWIRASSAAVAVIRWPRPRPSRHSRFACFGVSEPTRYPCPHPTRCRSGGLAPAAPLGPRRVASASGSRILFREPSVWDQYRAYIIGATMLMLTQAALIAGLLVQRHTRQRIEVDLRGSQAKLRDSYDRIRHLGRRLLGEQEAERARVARELHDDIGQQLVVLSLELDMLRSDRTQDDGAKRLSRALETTQGISTSVRELSHRLHPAKLRLIGLVGALDGLRRDFSLPHLPIAFCHRHVPAEIDQNVALCVFRVAQEALVNAIKHGDAGHIWVDLSGGPSSVALTITDDGKGFDFQWSAERGARPDQHERTRGISWGCSGDSRNPEAGTRLRVTILNQASEAAPAAIASA
jgi:signal transduction histidine kinase